MSKETSNATVASEKVTFKQLQRYGAKLSVELKHAQPYTKWYVRFMARSRLSILIFGVRIMSFNVIFYYSAMFHVGRHFSSDDYSLRLFCGNGENLLLYRLWSTIMRRQ